MKIYLLISSQYTEMKSKGIFSLPLYPELEVKSVKNICSKLKIILSKID